MKIIVYSHGFGVQKDDRGLFTDISASLPDFEHVLFEYNKIDSQKNQTTVSSLTEQAKKLEQTIAKVRKEHPDEEINLICHSQGCTVAAMLNPDGISKTIFTAPPMSINKKGMMDFFAQRPGAKVDVDGLTSFPRRDGSTTIIPADYWKSLEGLEPQGLYNAFSKQTELTIIKAEGDEVLRPSNDEALDKNINIITLPGDHNFTGNGRQGLVDTIIELLSPAGDK